MNFFSALYGFFTVLEAAGLLKLKIQKGLFFGKESGQRRPEEPADADSICG